MSEKLKEHIKQTEKEKQRRSASFEFKRKQSVERQRAEREKLEKSHQDRWNSETNARAKRLTSGLQGIWQRLTGKYAKIKHQNEQEALLALQRDRKEKDKPSKLKEEFRKVSENPKRPIKPEQDHVLDRGFEPEI